MAAKITKKQSNLQQTFPDMQNLLFWKIKPSPFSADPGKNFSFLETKHQVPPEWLKFT